MNCLLFLVSTLAIVATLYPLLAESYGVDWLEEYFESPKRMQFGHRPNAFKTEISNVFLEAPVDTNMELRHETELCEQERIDKKAYKRFKELHDVMRGQSIGCDARKVKSLGELLNLYVDYPNLMGYLSYFGGQSIAFCVFNSRRLSRSDATAISPRMGHYLLALRSYYNTAENDSARWTLLNKFANYLNGIGCGRIWEYRDLVGEAVDYPNLADYGWARLCSEARLCVETANGESELAEYRNLLDVECPTRYDLYSPYSNV